MGLKKNIIARCFSILAITVTVIFLNSCLSLDTDVRLRKDGSVDALLTYRIAPEAADFGRGFGADEAWPLPLSEKDFKQQSMRIPEVELIKYRVRISSDGIEQIEVKLKAESMDALARYLDIDMTVSKTGDSGTLVMKIPVADEYANVEDELRGVLDDVAGTSVFSFSFRPPSSPVTLNTGLIENRKATIEFSLTDLLYGNVPDSWEVSW